MIEMDDFKSLLERIKNDYITRFSSQEMNLHPTDESSTGSSKNEFARLVKKKSKPSDVKNVRRPPVRRHRGRRRRQ